VFRALSAFQDFSDSPLATCIGREVYSGLSDPTAQSSQGSTSLVMTKANGDEVGHVLYDGYGAVLTSTLPATLTTTQAGSGDVPDPDTGLVYLGDGRYYDPTLGRPLQPDPTGGPPALPQALNRYSATPWGPPGVAEGAHQAGLSPTASTVGLSSLSAGGGMALSAYARASGVLFIQANQQLLARAGYADLFTRLNRPGRGYSALYASRRVVPGSGQTYRVLGTDEVIDLDILKSSERSKRWLVRYPWGEPFLALDDTGLKRLLRSPGGEFGANFALNLALAYPELRAPWEDPYFNTSQKVIQNAVTTAGVLAVTGAGWWVAGAAASLGVPVVFVAVVATGVIVTIAWNALIPPIVSSAFRAVGRPDPYQRVRNLAPLP
jgi:hypothetical protein